MTNFFSDGSPFLNHPLLTPERTAREIDFLLSQLDLTPGARALDVGCGFGRHSIELARRGYRVLGIDPAPAMIEAARAQAAQAGISVDFRVESGEAFVADEEFDAAICLFTTLGQISEGGEDNRQLLERVYRALRPGGTFAVEVPQRDPTVRNLRPADRFEGPKRYTDVTRHFDPEDNSVTEIFEVVSPDETRRYDLRYRLYSPEELVALLQEAGFTVLTVYGDYEGTPLDPESPTILVIARKTPKPSQVDTLADRIAADLQGKGESLESMLQALREERERYGE
jgi:2-polyprenyl-3-methyl-5-hydroxy-6-metoxy-1,4-benzoquinol methylase